MDFIADLHIHSPYSRATSPQSTLAGLAGWAAIKGVTVVGTGDFTHPVWFDILNENLTPAEPGLYKLQKEAEHAAAGLPSETGKTRFMLSAEISCIYKRHGKTRKVHNLLYLPDLDSVHRLNVRLAKIGNIVSDGRPILGLDSRDLLEILLEINPDSFLVPAHVWTPWFSIFGSKSGFDSVEECFGDLSSHIFAMETGLSSDPGMNRLISSLDRYTLISNSDCHSPSNLGRETNIFSTGLDYFSIRDAIRSNDRMTFRGTVEFFPEEGKYHIDGHRECGISIDPLEAPETGKLCPGCGRELTIGVLRRIMELADRKEPHFPRNAPKVFSLVPLREILGEILGVSPSSKKVTISYAGLIKRFGSELTLLLHAPVEDFDAEWPLLGEALKRMRKGDVLKTPGYDGVYGSIRLFGKDELKSLKGSA